MADKENLEEKYKDCKTITLTPTWKGIFRIYVEVANNAKTAEGRNTALKELTTMAELADKVSGNYILSPEQYEKVKHLLTDKS